MFHIAQIFCFKDVSSSVKVLCLCGPSRYCWIDMRAHNSNRYLLISWISPNIASIAIHAKTFPILYGWLLRHHLLIQVYNHSRKNCFKKRTESLLINAKHPIFYEKFDRSSFQNKINKKKPQTIFRKKKIVQFFCNRNGDIIRSDYKLHQEAIKLKMVFLWVPANLEFSTVRTSLESRSIFLCNISRNFCLSRWIALFINCSAFSLPSTSNPLMFIWKIFRK